MLRLHIPISICALALMWPVLAAPAAGVKPQPDPRPRTSLPGQVPQHHNEYELTIYRLPAGSEVARQVCGAVRKCEKKVSGPYSFYAFSSKFDEFDSDFARMNVSRLQQYAVSANYEFILGKYFSVAFKKSGTVGEQVLFEDVSFVVRPMQLDAGKMEVDVFGMFKYHLLGSGQKISPSGRNIKFKSSISESKNFFLIAEAQVQKNEPVYLAVIKQCDEIIDPSYEVKMLEKGL
ncbi:hypothetical protein UNDKW_5104 [Undibacterium sp. KW1]|uniref:hypothetical protein n=1 Tax=Undibacterium sp. KW1 TaxID=2058624 RepID=UPI001331D3C6|nr:hypothetical protein [Undibacterium sp. KW1]BBB63377.1 hypothetical protein UNDKW_5104 [Undibacterium sp. KW1]